MKTNTKWIKVNGKMEIIETLELGDELLVAIGSDTKAPHQSRAEVVQVKHNDNQDGTKDIIYVVKLK